MGFENIYGLYALLALIPFIILYLRRPKPLERVIPSLMFLMKEQKHTRQSSFLRKLLQNLLFILQLIALACLGFAIAIPYINVSSDIVADTTVIIIDASASMQTKYGLTTRFDKAIEKVKNELSSKNGIILAENNPLIILEDGRKDEAISLLNKLKPRATATNLGDALLFARSLLKGRGRIIVASDFITTEGPDILTIKKTLLAGGNEVKFIDVGGKAKNIGIVELEIDKTETKVFIKNFNEKKENVRVKLKKEDQILDENTIEILPKSVESLVFTTPTELSKIELDVKDDLDIDNIAFISAPEKMKTDVLLMTNQKKTNYVKSALEASKNINLEIREPPATNAESIDHDVVVINKITKDKLLPHEFDYLAGYVKKGGNLIITAQDNLHEINTADLLPVKLNEKGEKANACIDIFIHFTKMFEKNRCFTDSKYFKTQTKNDSVTIASAGEHPILSLKEYGDGKVFYYGVFDDTSDFKTSINYPIFWNYLLEFLTQTEDIRDYNSKTGEIIAIEEQKAKTPSGFLTASRLLLDEAGVYELKNRKIAVNLANEKESDISTEERESIAEGKTESGMTKEKVKVNFEMPLLILVFLILCFEMVYIKVRGDL